MSKDYGWGVTVLTVVWRLSLKRTRQGSSPGTRAHPVALALILLLRT